MSYEHSTAMLTEAVDCLNCRPGKTYVDGTLGGAGHARAICERIFPGGCFIGIDQDEAAIMNATSILKPFGDHVHLIRDNFVNLPAILLSLGITAVDGVLLDLGISQYHLQQSGRGFSFSRDEPLDMRMDTRLPRSAGDLVNDLPVGELERIFKTYGEERWARRIAGRIVTRRIRSRLESSRELADLIVDAVPAGGSGPSANSSGHTGFYGTSNCRKRRTGGFVGLSGKRAGVHGFRRKVVYPFVPFTGGSHSEAAHETMGERVHLSARVAVVCLREEAACPESDIETASPRERRNRGESDGEKYAAKGG